MEIGNIKGILTLSIRIRIGVKKDEHKQCTKFPGDVFYFFSNNLFFFFLRGTYKPQSEVVLLNY